MSIRNLSINAALKHGSSTIVNNLSFSVASGERLAIVGESGCGKTMMAMSFFGLLPENCTAQGEALFKGINILRLKERELERMRGKDFVLIPQSGADFLNPVLKIRFQMYEALRKNGFRGPAMEAKAAELLTQVGFTHCDEVLDKYPFQLSGGMAQRVILAIGLACTPQLVVADEPTRGVDNENSSHFIHQLTTMFMQAAIIVITHDISVASSCSILLVMYNGELMEYGNTDIILQKPSHPYTQSLIRALPENGFAVGVPAISQRIPEISNGCSFCLKCPVATEKCCKSNPPAVEKDGVFIKCFYGDDYVNS